MSERARQLYDTAVEQVRRGQVRPALVTLLDVLRHAPDHREALQSSARICRMLGSELDALLFERVAAEPEDPQALFELGYRLVDQGRPETAAALLAAALAVQPEDRSLRRELAFARLQSRDFTGCLTLLGPLAEDPALAETERLDVLLTAAEAALLAGRRELCADLLEQAEQIVPDDAQRERHDALALQLGRARRLPSLERVGLREWHYVQHAGVILKTAGGYFEDGSRAGRYDVVELRPDRLAFLLQRLVHLLERLGLLPDAVEPASELAAPIAAALALRCGAVLRAVADDAADDAAESTLLVAVSAQEFEAHAARLADHRPELRCFSVFLDWERAAPICPEVVGLLARRALLPWETRFAIPPEGGAAREVVGDHRPAAEIGAELVALMDSLPEDDGLARRQFEEIYMPFAPDLVLGHAELHPARRRFTPLSPCWTALPRGRPGAERAFDSDADGSDGDEPDDGDTLR